MLEERLHGSKLLDLVTESPAEILAHLDDIHPEDLAQAIAHVGDERAVKLIESLPTEFAAQVFARLDEERQGQLAESMETGSIALIATEMDTDDRVDLFSILPPSVGEPLLQELERVDPAAAEDVEDLARWPDSSAGGLMTTDFIAVTLDLPLSTAMEEIRSKASEAENVNVIFVLDADGQLRGALTLRHLLLSSPTQPVEEVMLKNVISVRPELDQEEAARILAKYDLNALAVTDERGVMLGVITPDDIIDVVVEEQAEDVQKFGGMEALDAPYLQTTFWSMIRKRAGWLSVLFVGEMLTANAMTTYEGDLARAVVLATFVPLIISSGGNAGSQASTLIIRAMAVGEVTLGNWWKVIRREVRSGLTLGLFLAALGAGRILFAEAVFDSYGTHYLLLAATVATSLVGVVTWGTISGSMLPFVLRRLGLDPASASAPFVATLVDVLGLIIYFETARLLLGGALT